MKINFLSNVSNGQTVRYTIKNQMIAIQKNLNIVCTFNSSLSNAINAIKQKYLEKSAYYSNLTILLADQYNYYRSVF
jgi:hypothetical protein